MKLLLLPEGPNILGEGRKGAKMGLHNEWDILNVYVEQLVICHVKNTM